MNSPKRSITATIEGNVIDVIYVDELEIHAVLSYHCASYCVWPGPLLIVLYMTRTAKILDTPELEQAPEDMLSQFYFLFCLLLFKYGKLGKMKERQRTVRKFWNI